MHDEHVPHPMPVDSSDARTAAPQRLLSQLRVELEQRISTHWHKETLEKAVRNAARRINASTVTI